MKRTFFALTVLLVCACHRSETVSTGSTTETTSTVATTSTIPATDTTPTYATTNVSTDTISTTERTAGSPARPQDGLGARPTLDTAPPASTTSTQPAPTTSGTVPPR